VRPANQFEFCRIAGSISLPIDDHFTASKVIELMPEQTERIVFICRRGNDSQLAVRILQKELKNRIVICDLIGGLRAWACEIDLEMPIY
jgi:adenylyltransferase/sulfurtransferase